MKEPVYYAKDGLSPIGAMKQGLVSTEQYKGFLIGNVIKYVVRAGHKDNAIEDLEKARNYIDFYLELLNDKADNNIAIAIDCEVNQDMSDEEVFQRISEAVDNTAKMMKEDMIREVPTDDPHINMLDLPDDAFTEDGELKGPYREMARQYLLDRRNG